MGRDGRRRCPNPVRALGCIVTDRSADPIEGRDAKDSAVADAVDGWYDFVRTRDSHSFAPLLDPAVVFESPVMQTPQVGRDMTLLYLIGAESVLGGPEFRYVSEWRNATGAVLEFETKIGDVHINGVDIISLDPNNGRIVAFKVMIRPLRAIGLVHELMRQALESAKAASPIP